MSPPTRGLQAIRQVESVASRGDRAIAVQGQSGEEARHVKFLPNEAPLHPPPLEIGVPVRQVPHPHLRRQSLKRIPDGRPTAPLRRFAQQGQPSEATDHDGSPPALRCSVQRRVQYPELDFVVLKPAAGPAGRH